MQSTYLGFRSSARQLATAAIMPIVAFLLAASAQNVLAEEETYKKAERFSNLFDGKTLDGWEGNNKYFRIEDEAIVAGTLKDKIPHNEFLCTKREYGNFELRLEAKLVGKGNNAGVQFRSKRVADSTEVSGYQADAGAAWDRPVWGALYDESRRRKMLAEGPKDKLTAWVKEGDWNELRILAVGDRIQIYLNGHRTIDYTEKEADIPRRGIIGLQIHSGPPTEAWYRNIRIREIDKSSEAKTSK
ncbi:MAG: DUF1080 domain-containing protein [Aureliella sp.]